LILTEDERRRLESARASIAIRTGRRAPRSDYLGVQWRAPDSKVVARHVRVTPATVCKWRGRFINHRLEGLYD